MIGQGKFSMWNSKYGIILFVESGMSSLVSGKRLKECGIPLKIGIQNSSSNGKDLDPVPGIRKPRCGILNPRLSSIPLHYMDNY